ncbi:photosystem II 44 kDa protein [Iris pallida]|uniref:Photosystem II 44 kDa protein (Plastid) n=1 Tax=Iris pallida TaxID=29817 RepID=A0AAX6G592_IRIPA|nr:photosystem II 44 kDa protein [Iris pallida]
MKDNSLGQTNKERNLFNKQKEREGFEPSIVFCSELYRFSRPELSTTHPSLPGVIFILFLQIEHGHMIH